MRRIIWIAFITLAACSGGNLFSSNSTDIALATALANAGVRQCVAHRPPPFAACADKKAGDTCQVAEDDDDDMDDMEARMCKALRDGRLVCVEIDDKEDEDKDEAENESSPPLLACAGKSAGDACALTIADQSKPGICRAFERDDNQVLACVPAPSESPTAPPIAACSGKAAGDACTVQHEDETFTGVCHALPSGVVLCLPPPPSPPQAAVDACATLKAGAACSFTFGEHTFQGACVLEPDGKTLVCAPVCKAHDS